LNDLNKCAWNFIVLPELEFEKINVHDFDALAIAGGFEKASLQHMV
jgi:protein deglycase